MAGWWSVTYGAPRPQNDAGVTDAVSLARHRAPDLRFSCTGVSDVPSRCPHRSPRANWGAGGAGLRAVVGFSEVNGHRQLARRLVELAMDERRWNDVDNYLGSQLLEDDPVLNRATETSQPTGLPAIAVSPLQGKFLFLLARLIGARQVLEVGTLGGYAPSGSAERCRRARSAGW